MYEEWREKKRENIISGDSLMVYFRKSNKAYSGQKNFKKKVLDFSENGLSIRIPANEHVFFEKNEIVEITDSKFGEVKGQIKYISFITDDQYDRGTFYRVSIKYL